MDLGMYKPDLIASFKSKPQITRVLTESWMSSQMYCPCCLNFHIDSFPNNNKSKDFFCQKSKNEFELKSSRKNYGSIVPDGAYETMIYSIRNGNAPNVFLLNYNSDEWRVNSLFMIPKFFITSSIIKSRNPLSETARRAGWVGCNFIIKNLPKEGKIPVIKNENIIDRKIVNKEWKKMFFLTTKKPEFRGWTADVLKIVQEQNGRFSLNDVYKHKTYLEELHPDNKNIEAKIRQQLQVLRDNKIIRFRERGYYEVI